MKIFKRLWMGVGFGLLALLAVFVWAKPAHAAAYTASAPLGFSEHDIDSAFSGQPCYFKDLSARIVICDIKRAKNADGSKDGKIHHVTFSTKDPLSQHSELSFTQADNFFCTPDPSVVDQYSLGENYLTVWITETNPPQGEVDTGQGELWPGFNNTFGNGKSGCGNPDGDGKYGSRSIGYDQIDIKVASGPATGPGSKYTKAVVNSATYTLKKAGVIEMDFTAQAPGGKVPAPLTLVDTVPYDNTFQYVSPDVFCDGNGGTQALKITLGSDVTKATIHAAINQSGFFDGQTCKTNGKDWPLPRDPGGDRVFAISNPSEALADKSTTRIAQEFAEWDLDNSGDPAIDLIVCSAAGKCSKSTQLTYVKADDDQYVENTTGCRGYALKLASGSDYTGALYHYDPDHSCNTNPDDNRGNAAILGTKGQAATIPAAPTSNPTNTTPNDGTDACVAGSNIGLEWLLCPITTGLSSAADGINTIIEGQLNFDTKANLPSQIHLSWVIIKDIASALVVILLLVMVLSQAIGGGPFDAYTVKKMLPKLVIAVIAMQLSWGICIYLIHLANDAGQGLKQIMVLPFGGNASDIDINSILNKLNPGWAAGAQVILPMAFLATIIIGAITLPATLVFIFGIFIGILAAFMVLLVRNILIIALVLFAPLAFLAWTMPGTQNLWKTWRTNFMKLLMMFPLIIAILYTGRIFAWIIASAGSSPNSNNSPGPMDFLVVMITYFAPYFFIFKAYQWGGGLMSAAGKGIAQGRKGIVNANRGWLETVGKRAQGAVAMKYQQAGEKERQAYERVGKFNDRMARMQKTIDKYKEEGKDTSVLEGRLARYGGRKDDAMARQQEAARSNSRGRRAMYRIGAGKPLWFSQRNQLETIARGGEYKKELVELDQAKIQDDYTAQLNATGSVSKSKEYIRDKYGFGNMKRGANGKMDGTAKDAVMERAFWNWVVDTRSAMELGNKDWRTDGGTKIDLAKTKGFLGMMNADPNRYAYIAQSLPELQPFNQAIGGGPKSEDFAVGGKSFAQLEQDDASSAAIIRTGLAPGATAAQMQAAAEMMEAQADDARHAKMQQNLEHTSDLAVWRPEQLEMMAANIKRLKRLGADTSRSEIEFKKIMTQLRQSNTPEARSTLQRLMGGEKSSKVHVNGIMGDRWLEDTLDLPVETDGVVRAAALPREKEEFKDVIMKRNPDGSLNKAQLEVARVYAEGKPYADRAHSEDRIDVETEFDQIAYQAEETNNAELIGTVNRTYDQSIAFVRERAQRLIKEVALDEKLSFVQKQESERRVSEIAQKRVAELEAKKLAMPPVAGDPTSLVVPHDMPTNRRDEWFKSADDRAITRLVGTAGGYPGLSNDDLIRIYNMKRGSLKTSAEAELRTRKIIT